MNSSTWAKNLIEKANLTENEEKGANTNVYFNKLDRIDQETKAEVKMVMQENNVYISQGKKLKWKICNYNDNYRDTKIGYQVLKKI
jgi:hypothetical protein